MAGTKDLSETHTQSSVDTLISVVIPAYNVARIIGECVGSVLAQTHRDLEVIVVDDRSTDDTGAILDALAVGDTRMKVLHLPRNVGLHAARVEALKIATGKFIGFVDGDDVAQPTMFGTLFEAMSQHDADIAICGFAEVHAVSRTVQRTVQFPALEIYDTDLLGRYARGEFRSGVIWNKLYRRDLLLANACIPLDRSVDSGADYIVGVGCFAEARSVVVVPKVEYAYLAHPTSMSRVNDAAKRFVDLLHFYVTCLATHSEKGSERSAAIDALYAWQFRFSNYRVNDRTSFAPYREDMRRSLLQLAEVHPEGVFSLVHVYDASDIPQPALPLRYHLGQLRIALRKSITALLKGRA